MPIQVSDYCLASRNHFQSPRRPRFLILVILLLYILATFGLCEEWVVEIAYTTIPIGKSFWTAYTAGTSLSFGITASLSTILTDDTLACNFIFVFVDFLLING